MKDITHLGLIEVLPLIAFCLLSISFVPQIKKIVENKKVDGISKNMILLGLGQGLYFAIYNIWHDRLSMSFAFISLFFFFSILLLLYRKYTLQAKGNLLLGILFVVFPVLFIFINAAVVIEILAYIGLVYGGCRVIPQMVRTIKTKEIKNLSATFFLLHLIASCFGLSFEFLSDSLSKEHVIFFFLVIITNTLQLSYMAYIKYVLPKYLVKSEY